MKIALDARWIRDETSGISAYTRELIRDFALDAARHEYVLLFDSVELLDRVLAETGAGDAAHIATRLLPYGPFSPRNQLFLPRLLRAMHADVFHSPNYMIPLSAFPRRRTGRPAAVVTIHDLIPMIFPHHAPRSRKSRFYPVYRWVMRQVSVRADVILTDSESSRADILRLLPETTSSRVRAIPLAAPRHFSRSDRTWAPPRSGARRLLYVGRFDPYKGIEVLIRAFARVRAAIPDPVELVLAGAPDPRYPEYQELARNLGIWDAVRWTGYLTDEELVSAYLDADLLVHPSRYEGFGLQVLEAMTLGLPVVSSDGGSLAEVAGGAAILCKPGDTNAFADAIQRVLVNPSLAGQLSAAGRRRAAEFSWARTTSETIAAYDAVVAMGAP